MDRSVIYDEQWTKIEPICLGKPTNPDRSGADNRLFVETATPLILQRKSGGGALIGATLSASES